MIVWILSVAFMFPNGDVSIFKHKESKPTLQECNQLWLDPEFRTTVIEYSEVLGAQVKWKCQPEKPI